MLYLTTSRVTSRTCDGVGRREFLAVGGLALGGLTLGGLLQARAASAAERSSRTKSVIVVFLAGGPSHIDMYDLKPDAPAEIRGEFQPVETNVPGVRVCDLMPEHARIADRWAVVNGVQMIDTMMGSFRKGLPSVPDTFWTEFRSEIHEGDLVDLCVPIYDKHFSEEDLLGLVAFYETPLGKRLLAAQPQVMQESLEAGQIWGRAIGQRAIERLKQKGYEGATKGQ